MVCQGADFSGGSISLLLFSVPDQDSTGCPAWNGTGVKNRGAELFKFSETERRIEMDVNKKRQDEEEMLKLKIQFYCRGNHGRKSELCEDCRQLLEYS